MKYYIGYNKEIVTQLLHKMWYWEPSPIIGKKWLWIDTEKKELYSTRSRIFLQLSDKEYNKAIANGQLKTERYYDFAKKHPAYSPFTHTTAKYWAIKNWYKKIENIDEIFI